MAKSKLTTAGVFQNLKGKRALLLLSGGPDSKTLARVAMQEGANLAAAIYLRTGSKTDDKELAAAEKVAKKYNIPLRTMNISDAVKSLGVERIMPHANAAIARFGIVVSLSLAVAYAHQIGVDVVLIALHNDDAENNIQYSQRYIDQLNVLAKLSSVPPVHAPLLSLSKAEVFELGFELGVDYSDTWSCSEGDDLHCGKCSACVARHSAFLLANLQDPTTYSTAPQVIEPAVNNAIVEKAEH